MAVREVAFKYSAKGANAVRRADKKVQSQVNKTAKDARKNTGEINRWMEANKSALLAIGAAASGALAGILTQSPTLRAELASARIGMSLLADTIITDVLPAGDSLADKLFDLEEAYTDLDDSIRKPLSSLITFGSMALLAAKFLNPVVGFVLLLIGVFVVLNNVVPRSAALLGVVAVAAGVLLFTVGLIPAIIMLVVGALVVLAGWLYRNRDAIREWIGELRDRVVKWLGNVKDRILELGGAIRDGFADRWESLKDSVIGYASDIYEGAKEKITDLRDDALGWGEDLLSRFIKGIENKMSDLRDKAADIKGTIEDFISFDQVSNDRMAERWGRDMTEFFAQGVEAGQSDIQTSLNGAISQPTAAGGNGQTVSIGEINVEVMGGGTGRRTGKDIAQEVSKEINNQFESRR